MTYPGLAWNRYALMIWALFFAAAVIAGIVRIVVGPNDLLMQIFVPALAVFLIYEWGRSKAGRRATRR